jgi:hypothetical protein
MKQLLCCDDHSTLQITRQPDAVDVRSTLTRWLHILDSLSPPPHQRDEMAEAEKPHQGASLA